MDYSPLIVAISGCLGMGISAYVAWFRPSILQRYLDRNSRIMGWESGSKKGLMPSRYYLWLLRIASTIFIIVFLGVLVLVVRELIAEQ